MSKSILAALTIATIAGIGTATGGASTAEAGYGYRSYGHFQVRHVHYVRPVHYIRPVHYVAPVVYYKRDCSHAFYAWKSTGSDHWKYKYLACKGW
jgi:hypothetical protein